MELFGVDTNPVPNGAICGSLTTADGVRLRFARWRPTSRRSRGTVCLFQGRAEQIEKYFEVIGDLRRRGFAVATFDWRGQGGSQRLLRNRRKGHIDSFSEYDRDLDAFMQDVALPDCPPPHFALAHSTGALLCLRAAYSGRARFMRMVLAAPLAGLGPQHMGQAMACRIAAIATAIGLGELNVSGSKGMSLEDIPFEGNLLCGDPARFARNVDIVTKSREIAIGAPTIGWLYAACRAMREATDPDFGPSIKVPVLVVAGGLDKVVSSGALELLVAELRAGAKVVIAGARHEIMMERDAVREQFWAAFDAFVPGSRARDAGLGEAF
jgi:lysophospholipase